MRVGIGWLEEGRLGRKQLLTDRAQAASDLVGLETLTTYLDAVAPELRLACRRPSPGAVVGTLSARYARVIGNVNRWPVTGDAGGSAQALPPHTYDPRATQPRTLSQNFASKRPKTFSRRHVQDIFTPALPCRREIVSGRLNVKSWDSHPSMAHQAPRVSAGDEPWPRCLALVGGRAGADAGT